MKTVLITIAIVFSGILMQAQEAMLKKVEFYHSNGESTQEWEYIYDYADNLKFINHFIEGTLRNIYTYRNDTLIKRRANSTDYKYVYTNDSIWIFNLVGGDTIQSGNAFYIDDENRVLIHGNFTNIWYEDNCVEVLDQYGETHSYREYYPQYRNPWYEQSKYLRDDVPFGFNSGSVNLMSDYYNYNGSHNYFTVEESIGNYPTIVYYHVGEDNTHEYHFEYLYVVTDTPEILTGPHTVLSVEYYDLLGRKIDKPKQGFYIERKITDEGIISTKHYIQ